VLAIVLRSSRLFYIDGRASAIYRFFVLRVEDESSKYYLDLCLMVWQ